MNFLFQRVAKSVAKVGQFINSTIKAWTTPAVSSQLGGVTSDLFRNRTELIAENAFLRQQLIVLNRQINKPSFTPFDRLFLVLLAGWVRHWKQALLILKPDTLLRWHRHCFRLFWKFKSKATQKNNIQAKVDQETIDLIKEIATNNPIWGAERIRGELLKLKIKVAKRTIQKYMRQVRTAPGGAGSASQTWQTFLRNHSKEIWACDLVTVTNLFFGQLYAFFFIEHSSRRIVHFGVTTSPTQEWLSQQLKEATPFGEGPKYLIRDNDAKYGKGFDQVAKSSGIKVLRTPIASPKANSICERYFRSLRQECLNHILIMNERHLNRVLQEYVSYYNGQRPHQGIEQKLPIPKANPLSESEGEILHFPVLNGLHQVYQRVA